MNVIAVMSTLIDFYGLVVFFSFHKITSVVVGRHRGSFSAISPFVTGGLKTKHVFGIDAVGSGATGSVFFTWLTIVRQWLCATTLVYDCLSSSCVRSISMRPYRKMTVSGGIVCDLYD